jgi:hypothetical protein
VLRLLAVDRRYVLHGERTGGHQFVRVEHVHVNDGGATKAQLDDAVQAEVSDAVRRRDRFLGAGVDGRMISTPFHVDGRTGVATRWRLAIDRDADEAAVARELIAEETGASKMVAA